MTTSSDLSSSGSSTSVEDTAEVTSRLSSIGDNYSETIPRSMDLSSSRSDILRSSASSAATSNESSHLEMPVNSPDYQDNAAESYLVSQDRVSVDPSRSARDALSVPYTLGATEERKKDPVWSILPSYYMYTSTVNRRMNLDQDEDNFVPPTYDDLATLSSGHSSGTVGVAATSSSESSTSASLNNNSGLLHSGNAAPPSVENASASTRSTTPPQRNSTDDGVDPNLIIADQDRGGWENTILSNVHQLKNLSSSENEYAKSLKVDVFFTEEVGDIGVKPKFIDISKYEYKQGNFINGYVLIENISDKDIPFDMLYVLFEGNYHVASSLIGEDHNATKISRTFLEMIDFSASWNEVYINRLLKSVESPICSLLEKKIDPVDGTYISLGEKKVVKPGKVFKRFFTFKIPEFLLDSTCGHNLICHSELPPTLGTERCDRIKALKNSNRLNNLGEISKVKDFSFIDSSISYSVDVRFIGKASMYGEDIKSSKGNAPGSKITNTRGDEFLILKDARQNLRIVQDNKKYKDLAERLEKYRLDEIFYHNLLTRVDERISVATELEAALGPTSKQGKLTSILSPSALTTSLSSNSFNGSIEFDSGSTESSNVNIANELAKCRQLYKPSSSYRSKKLCEGSGVKCEDLDFYRVYYPMQKRASLAGSAKFLGTLVVSTPKLPYIMKYIEPIQFRNNKRPSCSSWKLSVPIDLAFVLSQSNPDYNNPSKIKLPEVKNITTELVVLTVKSDDHHIPIDINHDMMLQHIKQVPKPYKSVHDYESNYFDRTVIWPMRYKVLELQRLCKKLGPEVFRMEAQLASDVKSISNLKTKTLLMAVDDVKVNDNAPVESLSKVPWEVKDNATPRTYSKSFNLKVDLTNARLKTDSKQDTQAFDTYCLVPNFQMCNMVRIYYMRIIITLSKGEVILAEVPIIIEK